MDYYTVEVLFTVSLLVASVFGAPQVPCYFIFGDSLVDNGNNNFLHTTVKANYPPYGIDYPGGATGRFTNGRTVADFIAELLGFNTHIPPYATAREEDILKGVNYASGGSGIREETGQHFGERISLDMQLSHHQSTVEKIIKLLGNSSSAMKHLGQCIYSVGMGSNDFINNYFMPTIYQSSKKYSPEEYAEDLIQKYFYQLQTLYNYGARKIAVFGLGPVGCLPGELKRDSNGTSCVSGRKNDVQLFAEKIKPMIELLNKNLPGAKFIYVDSNAISATDPLSASFKFSNATCCKVTRTTRLCISQKIPCNPRSDFVFFDSFHPTETAHMIVARRAYKAQLPSDTYPTDIYHLTQVL